MELKLHGWSFGAFIGQCHFLIPCVPKASPLSILLTCPKFRVVLAFLDALCIYIVMYLDIYYSKIHSTNCVSNSF